MRTEPRRGEEEIAADSKLTRAPMVEGTHGRARKKQAGKKEVAGPRVGERREDDGWGRGGKRERGRVECWPSDSNPTVERGSG